MRVNLRHLDEAFGFPPVDEFVEVEVVNTNWNASPWNAGKTQTEEHKAAIGKSVCRRIVVDGVEYPSSKAAAIALGFTRTYIWKLQQKGRAFKIEPKY
jgi:hypothetical protein